MTILLIVLIVIQLTQTVLFIASYGVFLLIKEALEQQGTQRQAARTYVPSTVASVKPNAVPRRRVP